MHYQGNILWSQLVPDEAFCTAKRVEHFKTPDPALWKSLVYVSYTLYLSMRHLK